MIADIWPSRDSFDHVGHLILSDMSHQIGPDNLSKGAYFTHVASISSPYPPS